MIVTDHPTGESETTMSVSDRIGASETTSTRERFSHSRWPYTYAYDFMRGHRSHFGGVNSRQDALEMLESICAATGEDKSSAQNLLAYAYCREQGIAVPDYPFTSPATATAGSSHA